MKTIKSHEELFDLQNRLLKFDLLHKTEKIRIQLPCFSNEENHKITGMVNRFANCNCFISGTTFMIAVMTAIVIIDTGTENIAVLKEISFIMKAMICGAVAMFAGMISGQLYYRVRLVNMLNKIITKSFY